ncbi:MAG: UDP-4-amino-4,6-dideoxy-N-acetyl-beta-L-altrosamine transaminase [Rhodospirillales bacterium]
MTDGRPFLPYGRHHIDDDDIAAVVNVLRGEWLTTGPLVDKFERAVAEQVGARHAVACSNGSTALHLAALGAGIGEGQIAVVPAVTFLATASAVLHTGADVMFADVDPDTALLRAEDLERAVATARERFPGSRVTCVLPVHMGGRSADMPVIAGVAEKHGLSVIEDAAHAIGTATPDGQVGDCRHSVATTFSFHPVKTATTAEGGAVTTNDDAVACRMSRLRNHGINRDASSFTNKRAAFENGQRNPWYYEVAEAGFNFRLSDLQCALGISQLSRLAQAMAHRRRIRDRYETRFAEIDGVTMTADGPADETSWHLAVALIEFDRFGRSRGDVMRGLAADGIGTQVHYIPLYRQPLFENRHGPVRLDGAEQYYARSLSIPLHQNMSTDDADRVVDRLMHHLGVVQ